MAGWYEQLTENKSRTVESAKTDPWITPGGLAPDDNVPTLGKMESGSLTAQFVVLIEGCKYALSNAPAASVASAYANASGGDWTEVLGGLFVDMTNTRSISPDDPFPNSGRCVIHVLDQDGSDTFGKFVNKRASGQASAITATVGRNDTTINVASTTGFASSGTAYLGAEAFSYTGTTATSFTGCTRGKWSPVGCDASGSGGGRFAGHQRVSVDPYHVMSNPVVSEVPRVWIGKRISVVLHTWNAATSSLNTYRSAQVVFAGRIVGISDDPQGMTTSIEVEHESATFKNAVLFRDPWAGTLAEGIELKAGRLFRLYDFIAGSAQRTSNDLTVVSGAPASINEIQAGYYNLDELCAALNAWLAGELTAGRIYGHYSWASPVTSSAGLRSKCYWRIEGTNNAFCSFGMLIPGEVSAFMGLVDTTPGTTGQSEVFSDNGTTNTDEYAQGAAVPFTTLVFKPGGPGRLAQEFNEAISYEVENERGTFIDQYNFLPASVKEACESGREWGFFLLDDKSLMVGSYDDGVIGNCWLAPFQATADKSSEALGYIGRRADEPEQGPVTLRQVMLLEGATSTLLNAFAYSTGTSGYNHSEHDTLAHGLGAGIPGEYLGDEWERSISNMPCGDSPIMVRLDEPTRFADVFRDDLRLRRAFIRWKDEHFEFQQWRTPLVANATHTLEEANKAAPIGTQDGHRIASQETDQWFYPVVKVDYAQDFSFGRTGQFLKSIQIEDQSATDEVGGAGRSLTLKMRNTYGMFQNTGAAVEELVKEYIVGMPMFSRPARTIVRSISLRYFETLAPGDIVIVNDEFARDPLTGARGIQSRAALVTRVSYNLGGATPEGSVRDMVGEVELFFLDTQRGANYGPCADLDWEWNIGGYSAGYHHASATIACRPHSYTRLIDIDTGRGKITDAEPLDASFFVAGDKVTIVERDPSDPASPVTWNRTILSVSNNQVTFTSALSAPAWDAAKKYRMFYQPYADVTATQADKAFQADDADEMVQDTEIPYSFSADEEQADYRRMGPADKAELVPTLAFGDGKVMDSGIDRTLAITSNVYADYKSAHQSITISTVSATNADMPGSTDSDDWQVLKITPIFFGTEHTGATVLRSLTVAPQWCSASGSNSWLRITLARSLPVAGPGEVYFGTAWWNPVFAGEFAQATYGPISSTTVQIGADANLSLGVKDLFNGMAFLVIEGAGDASFRSLTKCVVGPRSG